MPTFISARVYARLHNASMKLEGVHHVTLITGDAPRNVDFYTRVLGLRLVKKTVNQDDPTVYHLFYADEKGSAGADITFFEYPGATRGKAGAGMVHTIVWRVGSAGGARLLGAAPGGRGGERDALGRQPRASTTPRACATSCAWSRRPDEPLVGEAARRSRRSTRCRASTAFAPTRSIPSAARRCSRTRSASSGTAATRWEARGDQRGGLYAYDAAPEGRGIPGAGTVHHVAWATTIDEHEAWQQRVAEAGHRPTPVIDRFYFKSIYFREPSGILFEIATLGPGFATDEDPEHLGERLPCRPTSSTCASRSSRG